MVILYFATFNVAVSSVQVLYGVEWYANIIIHGEQVHVKSVRRGLF